LNLSEFWSQSCCRK